MDPLCPRNACVSNLCVFLPTWEFPPIQFLSFLLRVYRILCYRYPTAHDLRIRASTSSTTLPPLHSYYRLVARRVPVFMQLTAAGALSCRRQSSCVHKNTNNNSRWWRTLKPLGRIPPHRVSLMHTARSQDARPQVHHGGVDAPIEGIRPIG